MIALGDERFMGHKGGPGEGLATVPKKLTSLGVMRLMERAIWAQGLRNKLEPISARIPSDSTNIQGFILIHIVNKINPF